MPRRLIFLAGSVLALSLVVAALAVSPLVSAASAGSPPPKPITVPTLTPGQNLPSQSNLTGNVAHGTGAQPDIALSENPWGCGSKSNDPHLSAHNNYEVASGIGWTKCTNGTPAYNYTYATLFEYQCLALGIDCLWVSVGTGEQGKAFNSFTEAIPGHTCNGFNANSYDLITFSEVEDASGDAYTATTSNEKTLNCG